MNASSFDSMTDTYYGLLNNFPGQPDSTLDQKLVVADFSNTAAPSAQVRIPCVRPSVLLCSKCKHDDAACLCSPRCTVPG